MSPEPTRQPESLRFLFGTRPVFNPYDIYYIQSGKIITFLILPGF